MREERPLLHSMRLLFERTIMEHQQSLQSLGALVLQDFGLSPEDGWRLNMATWVLYRDVPDHPAPVEPKISGMTDVE